MRRSLKVGLLVAIAALLIAAAAYSAFWLFVANRIEQAAEPLAQSLRAQYVDLTWRTKQVRGFPFVFRVELRDVRLHDGSPRQRGEVLAPSLSASASPWNLRIWRLSAPKGLTGATTMGIVRDARIAAHAADGSILLLPAGGGKLWLGFTDLSLDAGVHVGAQQAYLRLTFPAQPAQSHTQEDIGGNFDILGLSLPIVPPPLGNPLQQLSLGVRVMGAIPQAAPREAATAWRDAGGTVELDYLLLRWDALEIHASGTLALDAGLQPVVALSGGVEGYPALMRALVAAGRIRHSDAGIADMALSLLSRPGPDGRPEIATSFTVQDGQMFLGPAKLGPAPQISW